MVTTRCGRSPTRTCPPGRCSTSAPATSSALSTPCRNRDRTPPWVMSMSYYADRRLFKGDVADENLRFARARQAQVLA